VKVGTFIGAICFFVAAAMLMPPRAVRDSRPSSTMTD